MRRLARSDDVAEGAAILVSIGEGVDTRNLIVLRQGGVAVAYLNACPHMGIMLDWVADRVTAPGPRWLRCTAHGALFRREDGVCVRGPCAGQKLMAVPVTESDGNIDLAEAI
ncbi:hypothetical protein N825_20940 [Skermanella stibiiresistens SB22]|uniref:Rieske domain-containing protein n=1 Tax=Skermanella stibiiresistens SB22 TaxID=1385369 RepID=W9GXM7_9PROT|nr:Rieske 2Fe-2S domain-containing protein [Skermanella stibiiresistens]EWY37197.1 hypothetical protein N825_20940 [Skermanella stibiiresistens SB22]